MKKILILPLMLCCLYAMAQTIPTVNKRNSKTTTTTTKKHGKSYRSKNGSMKARTLAQNETADSVKPLDKDAEHINSNYNESMPPLSPNSGSSSPR